MFRFNHIYVYIFVFSLFINTYVQHITKQCPLCWLLLRSGQIYAIYKEREICSVHPGRHKIVVPTMYSQDPVLFSSSSGQLCLLFMNGLRQIYQIEEENERPNNGSYTTFIFSSALKLVQDLQDLYQRESKSLIGLKTTAILPLPY